MMLESDSQILLQLTCSLMLFVHEHNIAYEHKKNTKKTESLYRFGIFVLDGYEYSVSAYNFKDGIVTFENESTHEKIKFHIKNHTILSGKFIIDNFVEKKVKYIRNKLSYWLKDLSDKLRT